ncbi:MAG: glycoside hydrolase family 6 protein [Candidatus Melainabacteria bacterium]
MTLYNRGRMAGLIAALLLGGNLLMASGEQRPPAYLLSTNWTMSYRLYHQPHAIWLDQYNAVGANRKIIKATLAQAATRHQYPELVVYSIPLRDLGQASEGGFDNFDDYWADNAINAKLIAAFTKKTQITPRIYLEPDALSLSVQYMEDHQHDAESVSIYKQRIAMLPRLIRLYQDAGCKVYLEGAHSDWFDYGDENIRRIAKALNDAGIRLADGLVVNVSNRQPVRDERGQAERNEWHYLGRLLPELDNQKLDVVVDTSRNGGETRARQYLLAPSGALLDNETREGRVVGSWKKTIVNNPDGSSVSELVFEGFFGNPKTLRRLLKKEKYTFNYKTQVLTAPKWLDAVGDVQPGFAPTDSPPKTVADRIQRFRFIKPPDDCDGAINCPAGFSKDAINRETARRQPRNKPSASPVSWE